MAEHHPPARRVCPGARSICGLARPPGADRPAAVMDAVLRGALWRGTPQQRRWHCGPGCGGSSGASSSDPRVPGEVLHIPQRHSGVQGGGDRCVQQRVRAQPVCHGPSPACLAVRCGTWRAGRVPAEANAALGAVAGGIRHRLGTLGRPDRLVDYHGSIRPRRDLSRASGRRPDLAASSSS